MRCGCLSDVSGIVVPDSGVLFTPLPEIISEMCHSTRIVSIIYWLPDMPVIPSRSEGARQELLQLAAGERGFNR